MRPKPEDFLPRYSNPYKDSKPSALKKSPENDRKIKKLYPQTDPNSANIFKKEEKVTSKFVSYHSKIATERK